MNIRPPQAGWAFVDDTLFNWQREAIAEPIEAALLANNVKDSLSQRTVQALDAQAGVTSSTHRKALAAGVRAVTVKLTPAATDADIQPAIDAACADGAAFPFC